MSVKRKQRRANVLIFCIFNFYFDKPWIITYNQNGTKKPNEKIALMSASFSMMNASCKIYKRSV